MSLAGWHLVPSPAASLRHRFFATLGGHYHYPVADRQLGLLEGKPRLFQPSGEDAAAHWPEVRWCLDGR